MAHLLFSLLPPNAPHFREGFPPRRRRGFPRSPPRAAKFGASRTPSPPTAPALSGGFVDTQPTPSLFGGFVGAQTAPTLFRGFADAQAAPTLPGWFVDAQTAPALSPDGK